MRIAFFIRCRSGVGLDAAPIALGKSSDIRAVLRMGNSFMSFRYCLIAL